MASAATISSSEPESERPMIHETAISSIKVLAESDGASLIPSTYHSITELHDDVNGEFSASMPVIDFSHLTSHDPQIHVESVHQLSKACEEWGFFMVVSNGRYESVLHRVILNNRETRMSLVVANGPALDKEIGPALELLEKEKPLFRRIRYENYFKIQQRTRFADKSGLDEIRISSQQG